MEWDLETHISPEVGESYGYEVTCGECPACQRLIVKLEKGELRSETHEFGTSLIMGHVKHEEFLFPKYITRTVEAEVPDAYKDEFIEASAVLYVSPKASAALSRRLLQRVLRDEFDSPLNGFKPPSSRRATLQRVNCSDGTLYQGKSYAVPPPLSLGLDHEVPL